MQSSRLGKLAETGYTLYSMQKTNNTKKYLLFGLAGILLLAGIIFGLLQLQNKSRTGVYDDFALCLKDQGVKFYGAFWCPHCQEQKKRFGNSAKKLPYIECSPASGQGLTEICKENKIEGYPTWVFPQGITITSDKEPVVCDVRGTPNQDVKCIPQLISEYYKTWIFDEYGTVQSATEPVRTGKNWKFAPNSRMAHELELPMLAEQTACVLPTQSAK